MFKESIQELGSAIINFKKDEIHLMGFISSERLLDYYDSGYKCWYSTGVYPLTEYNIAYIQDDALFITLDNDKEISRQQFAVIDNGTLTYKDKEGKTRSRIYKIRFCRHSNLYNFKDNNNSILFDSKEEITEYLKSEFNVDINLSLLE